MSLNPVISMLGRRLRLAVIGGPGSFIGAMHRQAARRDDRYEILTGVLSSDPDKATRAGLELGWDSGCFYPNVQEMLDAESSREDGVDGFANLYSDAAEAIAARRAGKAADLLALHFPTSWDGLLGVRFVNSVIESSNANGRWVKC